MDPALVRDIDGESGRGDGKDQEGWREITPVRSISIFLRHDADPICGVRYLMTNWQMREQITFRCPDWGHIQNEMRAGTG